MEIPPVNTRRSLQPLSWLYGIGVNFRNYLFDKNILKKRSFPIPIICVGNLTVGGTGKTPHVEYLTKLLSSKFKVAILSRGYKRKSHGFRTVESNSHAKDVGDEPLQIKRKFPNAIVAVDGNRVRAIQKLISLEKEERPEVILLDDGFQHRFVQPSLSILLVDSNRPVFEDKLLPAGELREPLRGKDRASIVIVTKCNPDMQPIDFRIYTNGLSLFAYQQLFFTSFQYGTVSPLFPALQEEHFLLDDLRKKHVFLVTGIASPQPLAEKLEHKTYNLYTKFFPDHHIFSEEDILSIKEMVDSVDDDKIILTTEKDAMRFADSSFLNDEMKKIIYYLPVQIAFIEEGEKELFNQTILTHVSKYQTNS